MISLIFWKSKLRTKKQVDTYLDINIDLITGCKSICLYFPKIGKFCCFIVSEKKYENIYQL